MDMKEYNKTYYKKNKEALDRIHKTYNEQNKTKIKEYQKEYQKEYYIKHKKQLLEKRKQKKEELKNDNNYPSFYKLLPTENKLLFLLYIGRDENDMCNVTKEYLALEADLSVNTVYIRMLKLEADNLIIQTGREIKITKLGKEEMEKCFKIFHYDYLSRG